MYAIRRDGFLEAALTTMVAINSFIEVEVVALCLDCLSRVRQIFTHHYFFFKPRFGVLSSKNVFCR